MKNKVMYRVICVSATFLVVCGLSHGQDVNNQSQYQGQATYGNTSATNANMGTNTYAPPTSNTSNVWQKTRSGALNTWNSTKQGAQATWQNLNNAINSPNYSYNQKDNYVTNAQQGLSGVDQQIQTLSNRVYSSNNPVDTNAQAQLQDLEAKRNAVSQKLNNVQTSSPGTWTRTKTDLENSYNDLKSDLGKVRQTINRKKGQ